MKRITKILLVTLLLVIAMTRFTFAGNINANEQRIIDEASGPFSYGGETFLAPQWGLDELRSLLMRDDIDLTAQQADKAIRLMYEYIEIGVKEGLIVPASQLLGNGDGQEPSKPDEPELTEFVPVSPIKNTGFSLNIIWIALAVIIAISISAAFVRGKGKLWRYTVPIAFTLLLCVGLIFIAKPINQIFTAQMKSLVDAGNPEVTLVDTREKNQRPEVGSRYATISCDQVGMNAPIYYGDTEDIFQNGVGQYVKSGLPGDGETIILGGHDMTYFAPLERIKEGMTVKVKTSYGTFNYRVDAMRIADDRNYLPKKYNKGEVLVLYTCYPFGAVFGNRTDRYYVYCTLEEVTDGI